MEFHLNFSGIPLEFQWIKSHFFPLKKGNSTVDTIVLRRRDTKELTCPLRHITTEKSDLCQYAVCITGNTTLEK